MSPAGYSWAAERWSNATELQICLPCNRAMDHAWIGPMMEAAFDGLGNLEVLYLRCYERNHQQSFAERHSSFDFPLWAIILETAQRLRVLHLVCYSIRMPVSMRSLQHIILTLGQGGETTCKSCMSCIMSAGNLKTLHLECRAMHMRLGLVDLTPLRKLTAVSLRYVMPTSLVLPEQCALSVKVHGLEDAEAAVWLSVRQHLRCFNVTAEDEHIQSWQDLPAVLRGVSAPERVRVKCASLGTVRQPICLEQGLAHVHRFKLQTEHAMHICVPEHTSWKCLILEASGELDLEFKETAFQKDAIPQIFFCFGSMRGRGVMDLVSDRDLAFNHDRDCAMHYLQEFNKIVPKWGCYCQACCSCLKSSGVVDQGWCFPIRMDKFRW